MSESIDFFSGLSSRSAKEMNLDISSTAAVEIKDQELREYVFDMIKNFALLIDKTAIHEFINRNQVYEISFILKDDPCISYSVLNLWYKHNSKFIQELEIIIQNQYLKGSELKIVVTVSKTKCIQSDVCENERSDVFIKEFKHIKGNDIIPSVLRDIEKVGKKICTITEYQMNIALGLCSKKNVILFFSGEEYSLCLHILI